MKTIITANFNKISSKIFIGNCINGLGDPYFRDRVAFDATDLAHLVDNGKEISEQEFFNIASPDYKTLQNSTGNYLYFYNSDRDIAWFYDEDNDIEYFYV